MRKKILVIFIISVFFLSSYIVLSQENCISFCNRDQNTSTTFKTKSSDKPINGVIHGYIIYSNTREPAEDVIVKLYPFFGGGTHLTTITDSNGFYEFKDLFTSYLVKIRYWVVPKKDGYRDDLFFRMNFFNNLLTLHAEQNEIWQNYSLYKNIGPW
jgi:hypothetical protein